MWFFKSSQVLSPQLFYILMVLVFTVSIIVIDHCLFSLIMSKHRNASSECRIHNKINKESKIHIDRFLKSKQALFN